MKSKLMLIVTIILLMLFSSSLVGCKDNEIKEEQQGIESGFTRGGEESSPMKTAFRSDVREFDIDDLTLDVSFGWWGYFDYKRDSETFDYKLIAWNEEKIVDLLIIPNFNSEEYRCYYTEDWKVVYTHSEMLTIPKELLIGEEGEIGLSLIDTVQRDYSEGCDSSFFIYKRIGDNRVKIDDAWKKHCDPSLDFYREPFV